MMQRNIKFENQKLLSISYIIIVSSCTYYYQLSTKKGKKTIVVIRKPKNLTGCCGSHWFVRFWIWLIREYCC